MRLNFCSTQRRKVVSEPMIKSSKNDSGQMPADVQRREAKKATGAAVFGTFVEYYDFSVYGYVATTLAATFFPASDPRIALLNTLLAFGSAFLVRPLGALAFGWLGDRIGRRTSLIACITLMGLSATGIGLLPSYQQIGVLAPTLLVFFRMLQGFSTGGEIGGAACYIREWAEPQRRSLYISFLPSIGQVAKGSAAGIVGLIAASLTQPEMLSWGWRIPFLLALPLGAVGLYLRLRIADSPEFTEAMAVEQSNKTPVRSLFKNHRAALIKVIVIAAAQNIGTYIGTVFVAVYLSTVVGFSTGQASVIVLIAVLLAAMLIPMAGIISGRVGPKKILTASYVAYILLTIPSFMLMQNGVVPIAILGLALGMIPYALCQAGTYAIMPEFFPVQVRHTGVAFGHSTGAMIGGGLGPFLASWLITATNNHFVPAFIMVGSGVMGLIVLYKVKKIERTNINAPMYR